MKATLKSKLLKKEWREAPRMPTVYYLPVKTINNTLVSIW